MRLATVIAALCVVFVAAGPPAHAGDGEDRYQEYLGNSQVYPEERWQKYVQAIGDRLVAHSPDRGKQYRFYVLDGDDVNAFTPGDNHVFLHRGLIAFMGSEDELAAVIGHEIAHVVERHVEKSKAASYATRAIGFLTALATQRPELRRDVEMPLRTLLMTGHGRERELDSDRLGAEYMAAAGYNPEAIIGILSTLKDHSVFAKKVAGKMVPYHGVFASHPKNDLRLHEVVAHALRVAPEEVNEPVGDFWAMIDGLAFGDDAAGGLVRDGTFYHTGLRIALKFPEDWDVRANRTRVRGEAPGGNPEGFVTFAFHDKPNRMSPKKYVTTVLKRDDLLRGEELEIDGKDAFIGELDIGESNVQLQLIAVLYRGRAAYVVKGECGAQGDPERFRQQFRGILEGLRGMTPDDLQIANRRRLRVIVAEPGQTYAELAKDSALHEHPEETLRLLNADYCASCLGGVGSDVGPRPGNYIKIVQ